MSVQNCLHPPRIPAFSFAGAAVAENFMPFCKSALKSLNKSRTCLSARPNTILHNSKSGGAVVGRSKDAFQRNRTVMPAEAGRVARCGGEVGSIADLMKRLDVLPENAKLPTIIQPQ